MTRFDIYLALERVMLAMDAAGEALADDVRDVMDRVFRKLTDEERATLNARSSTL